MRGPISHQRRPITGTVAALVVLVTSAGCTSDGGSVVVDGEAYVSAMEEICTGTGERLDALPEPPEQIRPTDWATEVAGILRSEATDADGLVVTGELRAAHRDYVSTVGDLADAYDTLATALTDDAESIGPVRDEITSLSLGRDDVADQLGLAACRRQDA